MLMLIDLIQSATKKHGGGITAMLLPLGAFGLFFFGILDSLPLPIFAGSDILIAILAASHRNSWYEYATVATAGSLIGAYVTFKLARRAGLAYLHSKFGSGRVPIILKLFARMGDRGSRRRYSHPILPRQRVLRSRRCFQLPDEEILHCSRALPGFALFIPCNPRRPLWKSGHPCASAPGAVLGLAVARRRNHSRCCRHCSCNK